ncbi:MAG: PilZ domain-containing protein [Polyangiaceae bacterium]
MSMILVPASQRRAVRRDIRIRCQVVRQKDFRLLGDLAVDLSTSGMLLLSRLPVLTGEDVIVSFRAPSSRTWIDTEATVARVIHGRRPGDFGRGLGIEWTDLDRKSRGVLRASLMGVPPPMPTRERRVDYAATIRNLLVPTH